MPIDSQADVAHAQVNPNIRLEARRSCCSVNANHPVSKAIIFVSLDTYFRGGSRNYACDHGTHFRARPAELFRLEFYKHGSTRSLPGVNQSSRTYRRICIFPDRFNIKSAVKLRNRDWVFAF